MDWLILILGVPAILIPLVLLFGFAGCATVVCTDDADCPAGTVCFQGACVVDAPPPLSAPENLAAIALDDHSVALTWTSDDPPGTVFQIERAEEDGQFEPIASTDLEDVSATGATDRSRGLQEGVTFIYRVGAASEQEDPVFSDDTSSATVFPAAPVNLRATPVSFDEIRLSWDNVSAIATDFIVEHRVPGGAVEEFPVPPTTAPRLNIKTSLRERGMNTASSPSLMASRTTCPTKWPRETVSDRRRRRSYRRRRSRSPRCSRRRPGH
jgi:hypothetical protein